MNVESGKKNEDRPGGKIQASVMSIRDRAESGSSAYVIATVTGGQGKTLTAQVIAYALTKAGFKPKLAAADAISTLPGGARGSKFGSLLPDVIELGTGPAVEDVEGALSYWDSLVEVIKASPVVVDVGANLILNILDWGRATRARELFGPVEINLIVPVTVQVKSLQDALELVSTARRGEKNGGLIFKRIVIVLNGVDGIVLENPEAAQLVEKMRQTLDVAIAVMAHEPQLVYRIENVRKGLAWGRGLDRFGVRKELGIPKEGAAHRAVFGFAEWLDATVASFATAGIVGPENGGGAA